MYISLYIIKIPRIVVLFFLLYSHVVLSFVVSSHVTRCRGVRPRLFGVTSHAAQPVDTLVLRIVARTEPACKRVNPKRSHQSVVIHVFLSSASLQ